MKRRKFLTWTLSFYSTALHTLPSLMNWYGHAYALSEIRINCLQILGRNGRPYYYKKKLSFLELMTPECSLFLRVLNKIHTINLKVQYRMVPAISELANIVSLRNVHSRILSASHCQHTLPNVQVLNCRLFYFVSRVHAVRTQHLAFGVDLPVRVTDKCNVHDSDWRNDTY